ncbi:MULTISPECIES: hypothetical protein [Bacillus]|nr:MULTISPECIES: hypothetical protein [Bacillus]MBS2762966.1 hypothetical protein [Bacillus licheniformis]PAK35544.1 hypothetical protein CHH87_19225 [Bacillus licheniformis]TWK98496.1 hypothetical protein CHCC20323_1855 [Bacillus licheniformis]
MLSGILEGSEMPQRVGRLAGLRLRADPEGEPKYKAPHQEIENLIAFKKEGQTIEITKETLNLLINSNAATAATLIGIFSLILTAIKKTS